MRGLAEIVRLRTAECRQAAARLPALAAGEAGRRRAASRRTWPSACAARPRWPPTGGSCASSGPCAETRCSSPPGALARRAGGPGTRPARTRCPRGRNRVLRAAYVGGITVATAAPGGRCAGVDEPAPAGLAETGLSAQAADPSSSRRAGSAVSGRPERLAEQLRQAAPAALAPSVVSGASAGHGRPGLLAHGVVPSSVRASSRTRRSPGSGRRSTRPRLSSRSTSPVRLDASQFICSARRRIGVGPW